MRRVTVLFSLMLFGGCLDQKPVVSRAVQRQKQSKVAPKGDAVEKGPSHVIEDPKRLPMSEKVNLTEEQWKERLSPEQYEVLRKKGTERAFTGKFHDYKGDGVFHCAACGNPVFDSKTKFDSGTGWPSFWQPAGDNSVSEEKDASYGMVRTEIVCKRCGSHLGHVFEDGPKPSNQRYCINSVSLEFEKR